MIISAWWLRTSSKITGKKSKKQPENLEWTTPKRARIRLKCSAKVASSRQEDKDGTNKTRL